MSITAVLLPVFVQAALTFALLMTLGRSRMAALRANAVRVEEVALGERKWPPRTQQIANAYHNQFEVPVLFYALVALALVTRKADLVFVVLSWIFVASRLVHAAIHITSNRVPLRFMAFLVGVITLMVMWSLFALQIVSAEAGI